MDDSVGSPQRWVPFWYCTHIRLPLEYGGICKHSSRNVVVNTVVGQVNVVDLGNEGMVCTWAMRLDPGFVVIALPKDVTVKFVTL